MSCCRDTGRHHSRRGRITLPVRKARCADLATALGSRLSRVGMEGEERQYTWTVTAIQKTTTFVSLSSWFIVKYACHSPYNTMTLTITTQ